MKAVDVMKDAWQAYKLNFARLVIGTAITLIVFSVLAVFVFLPLLLTVVFTSNAMLFLSLSLFSLFTLIAIGVAGLFIHGYMHFASQAYGSSPKKAKKGGSPPGEKLSFMAIANSAAGGKQLALLAYAFVAALLIIFAVPYFYTSSPLSILFAVPFAALFLFFTGLSPCAAAFEKLPPLEAWGKSFELVTKHFWQFLGLSVILGIISISLSIIPIAGPVLLFLLIPWISLSFMGFYKKC